MRTSQRPARERASKKLATAATTEPKCKGPVGDGAKRPMTAGMAVNLGSRDVAAGEMFAVHTRRTRDADGHSEKIDQWNQGQYGHASAKSQCEAAL